MDLNKIFIYLKRSPERLSLIQSSIHYIHMTRIILIQKPLITQNTYKNKAKLS